VSGSSPAATVASLQGYRVNVASNGAPYVVRDDGRIVLYVGDRDVDSPEWVQVNGSLGVEIVAKDIGLGGPSIWAVAEDGGIYRWGAEVNDWELTNGQGSWAIAVDQHGHAWVVEAGTGRLLRGVGQ
jgi:hypothetical protein